MLHISPIKVPQYIWKCLVSSSTREKALFENQDIKAVQCHLKGFLFLGSLTSNFGLFFFPFPEIPEPQLWTTWDKVFQQESVTLQCTIDITDWAFVWFRNGEELTEDEAVRLLDDDPLLNITAAAKEHQGDYSCRLQLESRKLKSPMSKPLRITVYGKTTLVISKTFSRGKSFLSSSLINQAFSSIPFGPYKTKRFECWT